MLTTAEIAWTAGFLEGEGSFYSGYAAGDNTVASQVSAGQRQREPLTRLQAMFGGSICCRKSGKSAGMYAWKVTGQRARGLAMTLYPLLSPRRRAQVRAMLTSWRVHTTSARRRS